MNKVIVLLRNEWTKILRKKIVYIILILTVLGIVALGGIFKLFPFSYYSEDQFTFTEAKSEMENEILNLETEISNLEQHIESIEQNGESAQADNLINLQINLANNKQYKLMLELGLDKNINIYSLDFRRQLISDLADLYLAKEIKLSNSQKAVNKTAESEYESREENSDSEEVRQENSNAEEVRQENSNAEAVSQENSNAEAVRQENSNAEAVSQEQGMLPDTESGSFDLQVEHSFDENLPIDFYIYDDYQYDKYSDLTVNEIEQKVKNIDHIIEQDDYAVFIDYQIQNIRADQDLDEQQKAFQIADLELELKVNPTGKANYPGKNYFLSLQLVRNNALTLITNGYSSYSPLLPIQLEEAKQDYLVANYYLNLPYSSPPATDDSIYYYPGLAIYLGTYAIICLIIILAGSSISQEISTGSIKGLIIAPVKRYKIFFAKVLSIFSISVVGMLIVYFATLVSSYIFVEPFYRLPYAWVTRSGVLGLAFPIYLLLLCLSKISFVFITGSIALMFSCVTRSTSIAVGITMIMQFGLLSIYNFIKLISIKLHPIIAFLPFEYLDLSKYIFPAINDSSYTNLTLFGTNLSREFVLRTPLILPYLYWLVMVICLIWIARDSFVKNDL